MATSIVRMQGAVINGVRVAPGTNYNSYELKFGYNCWDNRSNTMDINNETVTDITTINLGSNCGKFIVFGRSIWPASNNKNGVRQTRINYSCTNADGTTSSGNIATQTLRPSQGNMVANDTISTTINFNSGCTNIVLRLQGYQSCGAKITVSGYLYAARM